MNQGRIPSQFIGPKWLTALHNIALSPLVMRDYLAGQGEALRLFQKKSPVTPAGASLSSSLTERESVTVAYMNSLIKTPRVRGI
jgi:hypothetical protein